MFFPALCCYPSVSFKDALSFRVYLNQKCRKLENYSQPRSDTSHSMHKHNCPCRWFFSRGMLSSRTLKAQTKVFLFCYDFLVCSFFFPQQEEEKEIILVVHVCVYKDHIGSNQIRMNKRVGNRMINLGFLVLQLKFQTLR